MAEPSTTLPGEKLEYLDDDPRYAQLTERVRFINRYWRAMAMGPFLVIVILAALLYRESIGRLPDVLLIMAAAWIMFLAIYCLSQIARDLFYRCPRCHWRFGLGKVCGSCSLPRNRPEPSSASDFQSLGALLTSEDAQKKT